MQQNANCNLDGIRKRILITLTSALRGNTPVIKRGNIKCNKIMRQNREIQKNKN